MGYPMMSGWGRPSPHGEGGLKFAQLMDPNGFPQSLPTRGGWIEICTLQLLLESLVSLPTRGGWIEIAVGCYRCLQQRRPSPHGEGGLKFWAISDKTSQYLSLPTRGGWIEMAICELTEERTESLPTRGGWIEMQTARNPLSVKASLPTRGGWIEISMPSSVAYSGWSLPTRGGWIEMLTREQVFYLLDVPPHTGRVD